MFTGAVRLGVRSHIQAPPLNLADAKSPYERALAFDRYIAGSAEPKPPHGARNLCGGEPYLFNYQTMASQLPSLSQRGLKRLLLVVSAGAGKTAIALQTIGNFTAPRRGKKGPRMRVYIVGDYDIFSAFKVSRVLPVVAHSDGEQVLLSEFNVADENEWCFLSSGVKDKNIFPKGQVPSGCTDSLDNVRIAWMTYVQFGNCLRAHTEGVSSGSKYRDWNPFDENALVIIDEAHVLARPQDIPAHPSKRSSARYVPEALKRMGADDSKNPTIVFMTATPILENPYEAVELCQICKGRMNEAPVITESDFYGRYSKPVDRLRIDKAVYSAEDVQRHANKKDPIRDLTADAERLEELYALFSDLVFTINVKADTRFYPRVVERDVFVPHDDQATASGPGSGLWENRAVFEDERALAGVVRDMVGSRRREMTGRELELVDRQAPKFKRLAAILRRAEGKSAVYVGAPGTPEVAGVYYLVCLSFYLQTILGVGDGVFPVLDKRQPSGAASAPAVFCHADVVEDEYLPREEKTPADALKLISSSGFRDSQDSSYNSAPCLGELPRGSAHSIILVGESGYKAFSLSGCSNLFIMSAQPVPKREQIIGRAARICRFKCVPDERDWVVNVHTLLYEPPPALSLGRGPGRELDAVLTAWYRRQYKMTERVLKLMREVGLGCEPLRDYSDWASEYPGEGFKCRYRTGTSEGGEGVLVRRDDDGKLVRGVVGEFDVSTF